VVRIAEEDRIGLSLGIQGAYTFRCGVCAKRFYLDLRSTCGFLIVERVGYLQELRKSPRVARCPFAATWDQPQVFQPLLDAVLF
jgi:hypothetical protein